MMTPKEMIETLIREIDDLAGEAYSLTGNNSMSTTYRCSTCTKLSHEHPNGNVKGCNRKALTTDEYIKDLKRQRDGLTDHVLLLRDGAQASVDKKNTSVCYTSRRLRSMGCKIKFWYLKQG